MLFIELVIVVALILLNGLLAMAELAVVSARRARLQAMINRQVVGARRALALASEPGKFLSTVQIGITLNGILSGAFSGATLGQRLAQWFAAVGMAPGIAEIAGVGLVVAAITYVSLIVGELVPKQIALRDPERIAVLRARPARPLAADRREFRHPRLALRDRRYRRPSHRQDPGGASRRSAAAGVELNGGPGLPSADSCRTR